ncbi:restriction endonuclease [candidate division KSB1 bacterium]|nr:restriction endonuclease [candidate division KSB1 bacterium]
MKWIDYEIEIYEHFKHEYQNARVTHNAHIKGIYSKIDRQIDILIEEYVAGNKIRIIVDGKYFNKKIDVKTVESFTAMLQDINAHKGLLITQKGFSKAAINRAHYDPINIELDILNFKSLKQWQGFSAMPYSGGRAVMLPAPFGWVIDIKTEFPCLCYLYQRGNDFKQAKKDFEFMYVNFWHKTKDISNIDELIEMQNANIMDKNPDATITISESVLRSDANTKLRFADIPSYNGLEITGYVEFDDSIFYCVLLTTYEYQHKNLRKLEYILAKIDPFEIEFDNNKVIERAKQDLKKQKDKEERAKTRLQISHWYNEMHDVINAIKIIEELITEFPTHYQASKKLLKLKLKTKNLQYIKQEMDRFFNLDPYNPTIYNDLIELNSGDYVILIDFFMNKISNSSDKRILANLHFYLAQTYSSKVKIRKHLFTARKYFNEVFSIDHKIFNTIDETLKSL